MGIAAVIIPGLLLWGGLAVFGLGALLARSSGFPVKWPVLAAGFIGVAALILAGFAGRAAYAPQAGRWPPWTGLDQKGWERLAYACLLLAGVLGLLLQWGWQTGDFTILLWTLGILGGYFTFGPPLAWYRRGWGEIWGSFCFGLLPVFTGYYLQSRHLVSEILLYGLPLSLAAFNLFLVLGFPNPEQEEGRTPSSLATRLGPVGAGLVFTIINILTIVGLVIYLLFPAASLRGQAWLWALVLLALVNQELIKRRAYYQAARIRLLGWLCLALYLGMILIFAVGLWGRL